MKNDLVTSISVAIIGIILGYFVCNIFVGPIDDVTVNSIDTKTTNTELAEPSVEVFNYRAVNPTVEVYVGDSDECKQRDDRGECIDNRINQDNS